MPTKKFQAETMMEALELVQQELGSDAIVLSSREIPLGPPWQVWRKPGIEVVAMSPDKKPGIAGQGSGTAARKSTIRKAGGGENVDWGEDRSKISWVNEEITPRQSAVIKQTQQRTSQPQPQVQSKTTRKFESEYLSRQHVARQSAGLPKVESDLVPADKPVTNIPSRQQVQENAALEAAIANEKDLPDGLAQTRLRLLAQGVDRGLVDRLIKTTMTAFSPAMLADESRSQTLMRRQLEAGLKIENNFLAASSNRVICLVGASGSGKTTTVSKLAVHFSKGLNKKVVWICADTVRAGAIAETRAYADAIGVPLKLVYTPEDLSESIQANRNADILIIDTPGYNPCDEEQMVELGSMLTQVPERSTYLVAPATTKEADLLQAVASLGLFKIRGLIITKLDETYSFGSVYNFLHQSQLPMALFSTGKQILGDLRPADAGKLVAALFGKGWE